MATLVRSKSCSFIPQDLPISELFSDIKQNREKILSLEEKFKAFGEKFSKDYNRKILSLNSKIRELQEQIQICEIEIATLKASFNMARHLREHNYRSIRQITKDVSELTAQVNQLICLVGGAQRAR